MGNQRVSARKKENKIIPMPLDANFFFERALIHLNRNNLSKALKYFWKIVDVEPNNPVHYCNLAGLLSEMGRFTESNELLNYVVEKLDSSLTECYYYMANNYVYLEELELSFKYIHRYLDASPHGEYANEAKEMLTYISSEIDEMTIDGEEENKDLQIQHYKAKSLLEEGKFYDAINRFKRIVEEYPNFLVARNNLALTYFYIGNYVKAMEQTDIILEKDQTNIHALSNLAIFYSHLQEEKKLQDMLQLLRKLYPFKKEDLHKIATTFAILGEDEIAFKHLYKLIMNGDVFNPTILHYGAVSAFNIGKYELAKKWWEKIKKLDTESLIANFYLETVMVIPNKSPLPVFSYQYELPFDKILSAIQMKQEIDDEFIHSMFHWGLKNSNEKDKEIIILGLASYKSAEAEKMLREFILVEAYPYSLKKKALIALEEMDAEPPYHLMMNGKISEFNRQTPDFSLWKNNWIEVLELVEEKMGNNYNVIELYDAKTLWFEFISKTYPKTPQIRKIEGWVAALEYTVAKMHQKSIILNHLVDKYQISKQTIVKNIGKFEEILKVSEKSFFTYPNK